MSLTGCWGWAAGAGRLEWGVGVAASAAGQAAPLIADLVWQSCGLGLLCVLWVDGL